MTERLAVWAAIGLAGGLTLALRLLPLLGRCRRDSGVSPTMDRFIRAFLACCIGSMVVGMLFPSEFSSSTNWRRETLILASLAAFLAISRFYSGLLLAPVLALVFVALRSYVL